MRLLVDTEKYRKDVSLANERSQEIQSKIRVLEEQRESLRSEESALSSQISEVTKQVEQRKVQRKIEEIGARVSHLKEKRDAIVSEHNVRIIEVMMAKISHLQNLKKELQKKLTVKRYREYLKMKQQGPKRKHQDAVADLRTQIPALQFELNQAKSEIAGLSLENFHLKNDLELTLQKHHSLRSQLGLPPLPNSD
jgi:chromosome segregation ATPase